MSTATSPPATAWWARTWWSRSRTSGCRGTSTPRTTTACRPSRWCRCAGCRQRASSSASSRRSLTCGHTASCSGRSTATACRYRHLSINMNSAGVIFIMFSQSFLSLPCPWLWPGWPQCRAGPNLCCCLAAVTSHNNVPPTHSCSPFAQFAVSRV